MTATKTLIALSLTLFGAAAVAKGSSHVTSGTEQTGGMVPIEQAQRIIRYNYERLQPAANGDILTCPIWWQNEYVRKVGYTCIDPKTGNDRWIPLSQVELPGFEKSGVQIFMSGSSGYYMTLVIYFRKKPD